MKMYSIFDKEFKPYGRVLSGYDFSEILKTLDKKTEKVYDGMSYTPSSELFEKLPVYEELKNRYYGGMPIQIGYCNGQSKKLCCLEYHRDNEIVITQTDMVAVLGVMTDIDEEGKYDMSNLVAFKVPAGTAYELYATTLHYAPFTYKAEDSFKHACALPYGTNGEKPEIEVKNLEDKMLFGKNKWLLVHRDAPEANQGAFVGLVGKCIEFADVEKLL